jgi:hypothetical protein
VLGNICGVLEDEILLDSGADVTCISQGLLKEVEKRLGSRVRTERMRKPVEVEFADGSVVKCGYVVHLPFVEFRQRHGGTISKTQLKCLVLPGRLDELIVGLDLLQEWNISLVDQFNNLQ